jgi:integrase
MSVRNDKSRGWYVDFVFLHPDGRKDRIRRRSPVQTRRGAEAYERQIQQEMLNKKPERKPRRREVPTFEKFADEFMQGYAHTNNKPSEVASKESILRIHILPRFGRMRMDKIGVREIEKLKARLVHQGLAPKTVNNILAVASKVLTHAVELEVIEKKPRIRLLAVPPSKFRFLDFEEYDRLLAVLGDEPVWGAAILTAGDAGLRVGEILGLHQEDVDHRAGVITVRRSVWRGIVGSPKGGRSRMVPMTGRLARALGGLRHLKGELVWSTPEGCGMTKKMAQRALERACRRAGLAKFSWHSMRHTFCSHLAMRGAAPKAIQELAGHRSIQTTMRYMHLAPTALVEAIGLLEGGGKLQARGTYKAQPAGQISNRLDS